MLEEVLTWPPNHWHWWTLAMLFLIGEILLPAAFFLGMAIAAGIIGLVLLFHPGISWEWQLTYFSLASLVTITLWRRYSRAKEPPSDLPGLNRRTAQYIGRVITLSHPTANCMAQVQIDGSLWRVRCDTDLPAGSKVRITGADGTDLLAEPAGTSG